MRIASLLVTLALLALQAHASETGHPVTLWKVAGTKNSVYLLGSIHLLRSQDYPLPKAIDAAYDDAEVLMMEIDMDDMDPVAAQTSFNTYGVLHDSTTLRDLMGDDLYAEAAAAAAAVGIPLDMLSKTEPWYAAMSVEIMALGRIGFDPALGVEVHMMAKAAADEKPIEGFETIEEQIGYLDGMSLPAQRDLLLSTLSESVALGEMMDDLIDAWRNGDVAFLEASMLDEFARHEELNKALILDRNSRWVAKIEGLLDDDDDYLIIVGAMHLVGTHGVPNQLKRIGYDVQQLSEAPRLR